MNKRQLIERLSLEPHVEGGYFFRTYRSARQTPVPYDKQPRCLLSSIFYMLTDDRPLGYLHRNRSDILHFFQGGFPLTYLIVHPDGRLEKAALGGDLDRGQRLQLLVPGGCWKATELESGEFGLVSEAVAPGFEYGDMELATETVVRGLFPHLWGQIARFVKP